MNLMKAVLLPGVSGIPKQGGSVPQAPINGNILSVSTYYRANPRSVIFKGLSEVHTMCSTDPKGNHKYSAKQLNLQKEEKNPSGVVSACPVAESTELKICIWQTWENDIKTEVSRQKWIIHTWFLKCKDDL